MKSVSNEFASHLQGEVTTLATCWKLNLSNGTVLGFTEHDRDIVFESLTYKAATGFTPTAIATSGTLAVDNLDIEGMLDASSITEEDVMAGLYDFAEIEVFLLNYKDVSQGKLQQRRGWLGEVTLKNKQFTAEVRGLTQRLSQQIGDLYSPACRAKLGDAKCKVNLAAHTVTGSITTVTSNQLLIDSSRSEPDGTFSFGKITFTSGANLGLSMEVKEHSNAMLQLALPMPYAVEVGDSYSLHAGCDKTINTCRTRFANVINFRAEPHVPGLDRMLETAGTRSDW